MGFIKQNDIESLSDQVNLGKMTAEEANIRKVEMQRVLLVIGKLPSNVRKALNQAVKSGRLGHKKRDNNKPEVFYKLDFEYLANHERNEYEKNILKTISGILI